MEALLVNSFCSTLNAQLLTLFFGWRLYFVNWMVYFITCAQFSTNFPHSIFSTPIFAFYDDYSLGHGWRLYFVMVVTGNLRAGGIDCACTRMDLEACWVCSVCILHFEPSSLKAEVLPKAKAQPGECPPPPKVSLNNENITHPT